eukprot:jgi/Botrbrau1/10681/Bobra.139_2s0011.1
MAWWLASCASAAVLLATLSDAAYDTVQSFHSDSAVCFSIFLNCLPDLPSQHPPQVLLQALEATITCIREAQEAAGITGTSLLNFCVSDGQTLIATRYVSHEGEPAASLYYAEGSEFQRCRDSPSQDTVATMTGSPKILGPRSTWAASSSATNSVAGEGEYCLAHADVGTRVVIIASEPITRAVGDWVPVPKNTALVLSWDKHGYLNVIQSPLNHSDRKRTPEQEEVARCLEAVSAASQVAGHRWNLQPDASESGKGPRPDRIQRVASSGVLQTEADLQHVTVQEEHRLTGHQGSILCLALHRNLLFSSSADLTIKVWDLESCKCIRTLTGHNHPIYCLAVQGDYLYSTGGRRVRIWDLKTWSCIRVVAVKGAAGAFCAAALGSNSDLYLGCQDTRVRRFQRSTLLPERSGKECRPASQAPNAVPVQLRLSLVPPPVPVPPDSISGVNEAHCGTVCTVAVCGTLVATAGADAMIRIWRTETLTFVRTLRGHRGSVLTLYASGSLLLSGGRDNLIRVWDLDALVCRKVLKGHKDDVLCIQGLGNHSPASQSSDINSFSPSRRRRGMRFMPLPRRTAACGCGRACPGSACASSPAAPNFLASLSSPWPSPSGML